MNQQIKKQLALLNHQIKDLAGMYHQASARSGISDNEFWVWYTLLVFDEEYSQQDICDLWSLPKQTVNTVVANLSSKGYLYLEVVPGTRNRKIIRLTDAGRQFGKQIVTGIYEAEMRTLAAMSEEERQSCITLLGRYIDQLKEEFHGR